MKIQTTKDDLMRCLSAAFNAVERRTTIPILGMVLIKAADGEAELTTTDLEVGMRCRFQCTVDEPGSAAVEAKRLHDYVHLLPQGPVSIRTDDKMWCHVTAKGSRTRIPGMDPKMFPESPLAPLTGGVFVSLPKLQRMVKRVKFSITKGDARFSVPGARFAVSDGKMTLAATDGTQCAFCEEQCDGQAKPAIIPERALSGLLKMEGAEALYIDGETTLFFRVDGNEFFCRKVDQRFADLTTILAGAPTGLVEADTIQLRRAIARASTTSNDDKVRIVKMLAKDNRLTVSADNITKGEAEEEVEATTSGPNLASAYNAGCLSEFLLACGSDRVRLAHDRDKGTSFLRCSPVAEGDSKYLYFLGQVN